MRKLLLAVLLASIPVLALAADTFTPNLSLIRPSVGSLNWGGKINGNSDILDSEVFARVLKAGDTMTGQLTVSSDVVVIGNITSSSATFGNLIVTTITVTGGISGDGSGLFNIPESGVVNLVSDLDGLYTSTGTIQADIDQVEVDTGTIRADLDEFIADAESWCQDPGTNDFGGPGTCLVDVSTTTNAGNIAINTGDIATNTLQFLQVAIDTSSLRTDAEAEFMAVGVSTDALQVLIDQLEVDTGTIEVTHTEDQATTVSSMSFILADLGNLATSIGNNTTLANTKLPKDGSEPMTGDLGMSGKDILNIGSATATGTMTASTFNAIGSAYQMNGITVIDENRNFFPNSLDMEGDIQVGDLTASTFSASGYITLADITTPAIAKGRVFFDGSGDGALKVSLDGGSFVSLATGTVVGGGADPTKVLKTGDTMTGTLVAPKVDVTTISYIEGGTQRGFSSIVEIPGRNRITSRFDLTGPVGSTGRFGYSVQPLNVSSTNFQGRAEYVLSGCDPNNFDCSGGSFATMRLDMRSSAKQLKIATQNTAFGTDGTSCGPILFLPNFTGDTSLFLDDCENGFNASRFSYTADRHQFINEAGTEIAAFDGVGTPKLFMGGHDISGLKDYDSVSNQFTDIAVSTTSLQSGKVAIAGDTMTGQLIASFTGGFSVDASSGIRIQNGGGLTFEDGTVQYTAGGGGGGISNVVEDITPQLGGFLDTNGKIIQNDAGSSIVIADSVFISSTGFQAGLNISSGSIFAGRYWSDLGSPVEAGLVSPIQQFTTYEGDGDLQGDGVTYEQIQWGMNRGDGLEKYFVTGSSANGNYFIALGTASFNGLSSPGSRVYISTTASDFSGNLNAGSLSAFADVTANGNFVGDSFTDVTGIDQIEANEIFLDGTSPIKIGANSATRNAMDYNGTVLEIALGSAWTSIGMEKRVDIKSSGIILDVIGGATSNFAGVMTSYQGLGAGDLSGFAVREDGGSNKALFGYADDDASLVAINIATDGGLYADATDVFVQSTNATLRLPEGTNPAVSLSATGTGNISLNADTGDVSINGTNIGINPGGTGIIDMQAGVGGHIKMSSAEITAGFALCINASVELSVCTDAVAVDGSCTCAP